MRFYRLFVRWGLGIHGVIHLIEFVLNLIESAWISASFTLLAAIIMLSGALIDHKSHSEYSNPND